MFQTPVKKIVRDKLIIPPSPLLKTLGFGTGVCVYEFKRSPLADKLRSPWAIKKIINKKLKDKELNRRLYSEAEVLKKLNHPNVVGFRAFVKSSKGDVLAMEECTKSLGDAIEDKRECGDDKPYPVDIILKVGHDVTCALNYLHNTALLLHCDIKSFNILVKNDFEICKLCDFGVCLPLKQDGSVDEELAGTEFEYVGTLAWSAPEILKFPQEVSTKADIYSFGLVLYEMLTLEVPVNQEVLDSMDISDDDCNALDHSIVEANHFVLPDVEIGEEYNIILEFMYKCAAYKSDDRPEAKILELLFKSSVQALKKN